MSDLPVPAKDAQGVVTRDLRGRPFEVGNPGRPKGARSKLGEAFIKAMLADFEKNGIVAVQTVRETKPDQYLKVIASILPKEITGEDGEPIAFVGQVILKGVRPDCKDEL